MTVLIAVTVQLLHDVVPRALQDVVATTLGALDLVDLVVGGHGVLGVGVPGLTLDDQAGVLQLAGGQGIGLPHLTHDVAVVVAAPGVGLGLGVHPGDKPLHGVEGGHGLGRLLVGGSDVDHLIDNVLGRGMEFHILQVGQVLCTPRTSLHRILAATLARLLVESLTLHGVTLLVRCATIERMWPTFLIKRRNPKNIKLLRNRLTQRVFKESMKLAMTVSSAADSG